MWQQSIPRATILFLLVAGGLLHLADAAASTSGEISLTSTHFQLSTEMNTGEMDDGAAEQAEVELWVQEVRPRAERAVSALQEALWGEGVLASTAIEVAGTVIQPYDAALCDVTWDQAPVCPCNYTFRLWSMPGFTDAVRITVTFNTLPNDEARAALEEWLRATLVGAGEP